MNPSILRCLSFALILLALPLAATAQASPPAKSPTTSVLAISRPNPNIDRAKITEILPLEIRATAQLYLDGKILAWYSKKDVAGVVFHLNCTSVEEAQKILSGLPLHQAKLLDFDFIPLGALDPLRLLVDAPVEKK